MVNRSVVLSALDKDQRAALEHRLLERQSGRCFICDGPIDLMLHQGQLDIDHIEPLDAAGADEENNFALTHAPCNRSKGASDLRVARRMAEFEKLQKAAQQSRERGANLGHVLQKYGGAKARLRLRRSGNSIELVLTEMGDNAVHRIPLFRDPRVLSEPLDINRMIQETSSAGASA